MGTARANASRCGVPAATLAADGGGDCDDASARFDLALSSGVTSLINEVLTTRESGDADDAAGCDGDDDAAGLS